MLNHHICTFHAFSCILYFNVSVGTVLCICGPGICWKPQSAAVVSRLSYAFIPTITPSFTYLHIKYHFQFLNFEYKDKSTIISVKSSNKSETTLAVLQRSAVIVLCLSLFTVVPCLILNYDPLTYLYMLLLLTADLLMLFSYVCHIL